MKLHYACLLTLVSCRASTPVPVPLAVPTPRSIPVGTCLSCTDCPGHCIYVSPYRWPKFAVLRFFDQGVPLALGQPFARRSPNDTTLHNQLQFGSLYFIRGNENTSGEWRTRGVRCIRGRDTMTVFIRPQNFENVVYDSIPFTPGAYNVVHNPVYDGQAERLPRKSFATYYTQHEADLARDNPFAGYRFNQSEPSANNRVYYVPAIPTDIFRLMLQHTTYRQVVGYTLKPYKKKP